MEYLIILLMSTGIMSINMGYFLCGVTIVFPIQLLKKKDMTFTFLKYPTFWLLLFFGMFYCLFSNPTFVALRSNMLTPILVFMSGWIIIWLEKKNKDKALKKIVIAIVVGFAIHALLNSIGNFSSGRSEIRDVFNDRILSATCAGGINTMIFSLLTCIIHEKNKWIKTGGFLCLTIAIIYATILASRTQFIIFLIVFVISFVLYLYEQKKSKLAHKLLFSLVLVIVLLSVIYTANLFGVREFIESSNIFIRLTETSLDNSDSIRLDRFFEGIESLFVHPFGGGSEIYYYHNMWLDIGRIAGIIPVILMILYTLIGLFHTFRIFCCKKIDTMTRYMILSLYIGLLSNFFVEPAMEGMYNIVLTWMLLNGAVEYYYYSSIKTIKPNRI